MGVFLLALDRLSKGAKEHPRQVMVVDEEEAFRRKIRDILYAIGGFQVVTETTSCRMALESVVRVQIDLVIADCTLADGDGVELTACLKQLPVPPSVILFASAIQDSALLAATLAGADGYLLKDTPLRSIIRAFKNFEHGGPAMHPPVSTRVMQLLIERCKLAEAQPARATLVQARALAVSPCAAIEQRPSVLSPVSDNGTTPSNEFPPHLSPQEAKVFALLRQGQRNKQIAATLEISHYTVSKHVQSILRKLGAVNRTQAAAYTSNEGEGLHFSPK